MSEEIKDEYLVLGVDPSLNSTGVCILDQDGKIHYCDAIHPSPLGGMSRLYFNYTSIMRVLTSFTPRVISFEKQLAAQRYNYNASNILDLAENIGILKLAIREYTLLYPNTVVVSFTASELKKYATGNSKATKEEVMATMGVRNLNRLRGSIVEWAVNDAADAFYAAKNGLEVYKNQTFNDHICE